MNDASSVNLSFGRLRTVKRAEKFSHVHGELIFEINGRRVPFDWCGRSDVCFNNLLSELVHVLTHLKTSADVYSIDEGEQGQPAFKFERTGENVYFSIVDSEISGVVGNAEWQRVPFKFFDLERAFRRFADSFLTEVANRSPRQLQSWAALLK